MLLKELGVVSYGPAARGEVKSTEAPRGIYHIGGEGKPPNPYIGRRVRVTWLLPWGGKEPGFTAEGILLATFAKAKKVPKKEKPTNTLIGQILLDSGEVLAAPWSKRYLAVEVLG